MQPLTLGTLHSDVELGITHFKYVHLCQMLNLHDIMYHALSIYAS